MPSSFSEVINIIFWTKIFFLLFFFRVKWHIKRIRWSDNEIAVRKFELSSDFVVLDFQIMVPLNHTEFIDILTSLVNNNFIPMSRIDDAVRRILRVKFTMGLFENPLADYRLVKHLGSQVSFFLYTIWIIRFSRLYIFLK